MDICSIRSLKRKIILEDGNGGWAQKHCLPTLTEIAENNDIKLWAIDIESQIRLNNSRIGKMWQMPQSQGKAHYFNEKENKKLMKNFLIRSMFL